jgi:uncharacterized protein with NRDE domain
MCLIALAWRAHPRWPLVLAANRDELHARPSRALGEWPEAPGLIGGRDEQAGGAWLLCSRDGRWAAVTNVRDGLPAPVALRSRGDLVRDFVAGGRSAQDFAKGLAAQAGDYGRFNLVLGDGDSLWLAGNHPRFRAEALAPGLHAVSNGPFDADWPKTRRLRAVLAHWLDSPQAAAGEVEALFVALADRRPVHDAELPDTGVGLERERLLAPPFVLHPVYGTRCSTVLLAGAQGIGMQERRFDAEGALVGETRFRA